VILPTGSNQVCGELLVNITAKSGWRRHDFYADNNMNNLQMAAIQIKCFHNIL
jgi:hypothetical protein